MNTIWDTVRQGRILEGETIIDLHAHLGPWYNFRIPGDPGPEGMMAAMDTCGIDKVVCAPHLALANDVVGGNNLIADVVRRYPERFLGYCTLNPHYPEEVVAELEKHILQGNLVAIKIHPSFHHYPAEGSNYRPVWEFAQEHGLLVLTHTWDGDENCAPGRFVKIAQEFPRVNILLGHSGGKGKGMEEALEAAEQADNLYLDLTGSQLPRGVLEAAVKRIGAERICFGTDLPFVDCRPQIGYVAYARISDEDKRKIFGQNALRLLHLNKP
ncbi:MAG TPA: amidohydrolase [Armatimonadetes bacterium]|nr:amidohydrolase [Armatimonadota bacterium]